jgi:hypothetical protein
MGPCVTVRGVRLALGLYSIGVAWQHHNERAGPEMEFLKIIALCLFTAITYGILHDLVTSNVCVGYFTVGHPPVFHAESPLLLALGWGVLATWWVGLILGVPLAALARVGRWPKLTARSLVRPFIVLMAVSAAFAVAAGAMGYATEKSEGGWMEFLLGKSLTDRIPLDRRPLFFADLCAHNASYVTGLGGGIITCGSVIVRRILASRCE